jgi:hypothetical protein
LLVIASRVRNYKQMIPFSFITYQYSRIPAAAIVPSLFPHSLIWLGSCEADVYRARRSDTPTRSVLVPSMTEATRKVIVKE